VAEPDDEDQNEDAQERKRDGWDLLTKKIGLPYFNEML
jgi:hypothetical protein